MAPRAVVAGADDREWCEAHLRDPARVPLPPLALLSVSTPEALHSPIPRATDPTHARVVVIGSGPAAHAAAIYAARANLAPRVLEGEPRGVMIPGGQLMLTTEVENYPGFPDGISGPELVARMRAQGERLGVDYVQAYVESVDFSQRPYRLTTSEGATFTADALIVATGANAKWLGLPNEMRMATTGGGVSACAVCDGNSPAFRQQRLVVVGGGDTAMTECAHLTHVASEVVVVHRGSEFRASKAMADRVLADPKTRVLWNTRVIDVLGDDFVTGVALENVKTGERTTLDCAGVFIAIGHTPNTGFLGGQLPVSPNGYLLTEPGSTATAIPFVFAAGDVADERYRQAITAAASGCMASLDAERALNA